MHTTACGHECAQVGTCRAEDGHDRATCLQMRPSPRAGTTVGGWAPTRSGREARRKLPAVGVVAVALGLLIAPALVDVPRSCVHGLIG